MNEVFRQEKKFLISIEEFYKFKCFFSKVMNEDKHSKEHEYYQVRSLYFDSIDDRDYQEKLDGVAIRRKIRLRNYGADSEFALLEMKQKQGEFQKKRSLKLTKEDSLELIKGNYSILLKYNEAFAKECYAVMTMNCYRPATVITYHRKAFIAKENKIRVTFDYNIVTSESEFNIFSKELNEYSIFDPYMVILEVKYNGFLLSYIKDLINQCEKSEISISKYCLGRTISKHYVY